MNAISSAAAPPAAGPYSQGIAAGGFVFLAGQGPFDIQGQVVEGSFDEQARRTFDNLAAVAAAAGGTLAQLVRLGAYLRDMEDFPSFNEVAREYLQQPFPARTTIQAPLAGFGIELDGVLWLG